MLSKETSGYCVDPMVAAGCKVAIIDFELCPKVSLQEQINQSYRASEAILKHATGIGARSLNLPFNPESKTHFPLSFRTVNFAGHSAGAHLLIHIIHRLIIEQSRYIDLIRAIYPISGVFDLTEVRLTDVANPNNILQVTQEKALALSPAFFDFSVWSKCRVAIKVFVAEFDSPKFIEQSRELWRRICQGVGGQRRCTFHLVSDHDHFDIVHDLSKGDFEITSEIVSDAFRDGG